MTSDGITKGTVRRSVSLPIILGYALNVAYCTYFYKFLKLGIDCNLIIPKLTKYISQFPPEKVCEANSSLWSGLIYFFANIIFVTILVFAFNRKFRGTPPDFFSTAKINHSRLYPFGRYLWLLLTLVLTAIYVFNDLRFRKLGFAENSVVDLPLYAWRQTLNLHLGVGLISFIGTAVFLVPLFTLSEN